MILLKHFQNSYTPGIPPKLTTTISHQQPTGIKQLGDWNLDTGNDHDMDDNNCMNVDVPKNEVTPLPPVLHTKDTVFIDDDIETEYEKSICLRMSAVIQKRFKEMRIKTDLKPNTVVQEGRYLG